jgi:hypothetical protein
MLIDGPNVSAVADRASAVSPSSVRQIAEHAQRVLTRRFRNESGNRPLISHEHDLFLVALEIIENCTEVAGDVGYGQRLHKDRTI